MAKQGDPSRGGTGGAATGTAAAAGIFEGGVKVSADKATNSLVVTSSLRDYAALHAVVDRLDQARRQVFIEAVIMDSLDHALQSAGREFPRLPTRRVSAHRTVNGLVYGGLNPLKTILLPDPTTLARLWRSVFVVREFRGRKICSAPDFPFRPSASPSTRWRARPTPTSFRRRTFWRPTTSSPRSTSAKISRCKPISDFRAWAARSTASRAAGALGALGGLGGGFGGTGARQDVGTKIKITPHLNDSNEVRLELVGGNQRGPSSARKCRRRSHHQAHRQHAAHRRRSADRRHWRV